MKTREATASCTTHSCSLVCLVLSLVVSFSAAQERRDETSCWRKQGWRALSIYIHLVLSFFVSASVCLSVCLSFCRFACLLASFCFFLSFFLSLICFSSSLHLQLQLAFSPSLSYASCNLQLHSLAVTATCTHYLVCHMTHILCCLSRSSSTQSRNTHVNFTVRHFEQMRNKTKNKLKLMSLYDICGVCWWKGSKIDRYLVQEREIFILTLWKLYFH